MKQLNNKVIPTKDLLKVRLCYYLESDYLKVIKKIPRFTNLMDNRKRKSESSLESNVHILTQKLQNLLKTSLRSGRPQFKSIHQKPMMPMKASLSHIQLNPSVKILKEK